MIRKTIIVKSPRPTDEYGDPIPDADPELPDRKIDGCRVWPRQSSETENRGVVIIGGWNVFTPPTTVAIRATDSVVLDGETYEIDGKPGLYEGKGYLLVLKEVGL